MRAQGGERRLLALLVVGMLANGVWLWQVTSESRAEPVPPFEPVYARRPLADQELQDPSRLGTDARLQLQRHGSDLTRPHRFDFYLYFPSRRSARHAAWELRTQGFAIQVRRAAAGPKWLCLGTRRMVPDEVVLNRLGPWLSKLAASQGGEYDGWEADVLR